MRRRRNGQAASCEPCRQAKTRCDHAQAICGRCRRRGLQSKCYYHPAPLTKSLTSVVRLDDDATLSVLASANDPTPRHVSFTPSSIGPDHVSAHVTERDHSPTSTTQSGGIARSRDTVHQQRVTVVADVLQELGRLSFLQNLIHKYYAVSKSSNTPATLVLPAIDSLFNLIKNDGKKGTKPSIRPMAEAVLRSTSKPILVTESTTPQEFLAMHTGESLRLEYLGIIYSIAGRASAVMVTKQDQGGNAFAQKLLQLSETCLRLACEVAPAVTDAMVWLSLENTVLCTVARGDDNEAVERHVAQLCSQVYAMGYHREANITLNAPFFLSECRKSAFAKAYNMEFLISACKHRPPRILMRYSDTKLPLDLADDEIVAEPAQRELACARLSSDGWNNEGRYVTASFRRVRSISLQIREETLEYEYRPMTLEKVAELSDLSIRSRKAWDDLPSHMKYNSSCWDSNLSPIVCMVLLIMQLGFLQNDFEIFKAMERADAQATTSTIKVAHEMLTLISDLSNCRGRSPYIQHELSSVILSYGLPCAVVLTAAATKLNQSTRIDHGLPDGFNRSTLIRCISVFVAQLDSLATSAEANAEACGRASAAISRTLDELLNAPTVSATPEGSLTAVGSGDGATQDDFQRLDLDAMLEGMDLTNWLKSIEGTGNAIDWCDF